MNKNLSIDLLRKMISIRLFEETVSQAKLKGEIIGQVHCCIGQEAVVVGVCSALNKEDYIISNHRSHGHVLAKGADMKAVMSEIYGKSTGTNGGKGGSMHIFDKNVGAICTTAIVGSGIPIGCGAAFASKLEKNKKITCVFFGDGASNEGTFSESLNIASKWRLPIIFLLENNGVAITTLFENASLNVNIRDRAQSYGIKTLQVDGQNVLEVYNSVKTAIQFIENNGGPFFIEVNTIRFNEHAEGVAYAKMSKVGYRDEIKIENDKLKNDPIFNYYTFLKSLNFIDTYEYEDIIRCEKIKVNEALIFALNSSSPSAKEAYTNIFI